MEASIEPVTIDRLQDLRHAWIDLIDQLDAMLSKQRCSHCHVLPIRDRDFGLPGSLMDFFTSGLCPSCFTRTYQSEL